MSNKFVVVDLETTGNSPKKGDKIIQFAATVIENGKISHTYSSLLNPGQPIPAFIEELTGINDSMVKNAPTFDQIAGKVLTLLDNAFFVAHNVLFDLNFLQDELIEEGYEGFFGPVLDTVEMARILFPTTDSYKLSDLAAKEGLTHERPHQADSDAYVTAELLLLLMDKLKNLPHQTIQQLKRLSGGLKSDLDLLLDEIDQDKSQHVEMLSSDLEVYRGIALKKAKERVHSYREQPFAYPTDGNGKAELLKRAFSQFEMREGQFEMMDAVYHAFQENQHGLIEAGTGIGKSLGYLLPAAIFAKQNGERVVVSTFTTQLQEQLLSKDIPLLTKMFDFSLRVALLKGRNHYLSLAKFEESLNQEEDNYDTTLSKMQILVWLTETETGDLDEINLSSGGMIYWHKIKNDDTMFLQGKSWLSRDFYLNAKKQAKEADLLITNHSLLLSDLASEHQILPEYHYAILDEGHQFEKAAGKFLGVSFDYVSFRMLLGQLGLYEQKQLFYRLENTLESHGAQAASEGLYTFEINQILTDVLFEMDEFFKYLASYVRKKVKRASNYRISCTLQERASESKEWKHLHSVAERFIFLLRDLIDALQIKIDQLKPLKEALSIEEKLSLEEIVSNLTSLEEKRTFVKQIFIVHSDDIKWVEMDTRTQNSTVVYSQPVSVADSLSTSFFGKKKSILITSATLSVKGSFHYMKAQLGLENTSCLQKQISSPFEYAKQVQLYVPEDLPEVNQVRLDDYVAAISEHIISIAEATSGRMLILFTSHEMLKKTHDLIKESGLLEEFSLIAQGITSGSRARLTRNFQRFEKSILFGTNSFWEGIDIPGEDLTCLIIVRLPFSPPDEPVTEAKSNRIKEQGGNPFADYSLPEAILRFKQGFGRLIRTKTDKGYIIVFDKRIVTTQYGKAFLQSIPSVPIRKTDIIGLVQAIENHSTDS
jgi:ATP-dependent DNA helicase DinG